MKNVPNILTLLRIFMIPVFIVLFLLPEGAGMPWALGVFVLASLTDAVDGYIARKYNAITSFGKLMDPLADKLLTIAAFVMLSAYTKSTVMSVCIIIIISRELLITGFRVLAVERGILIAADRLGKIKTILQMLWIIAVLLCICLNIFALGIWEIAMVIVTAVTAFSGANYIWQNRQVLV